MQFSDYFGVEISSDELWFDPILTLDTRLFLDPFLVYDCEFGRFKGSHQEIIDFFNSMLKLIARARGDPRSLLYMKALSDLRLPEVDELCIGYSAAGTKGSGTGSGLAAAIGAAMWEAITNGMTELTHFEEIALLREGIGADRISDATAGILRRRLAEYTEEVCSEHGIILSACRYRRGWYDHVQMRWRTLTANLPLNPSSGRPILLVPRVYLRDLPTISADDFWDYCVSNENETLRAEFNLDVSTRVAKRHIIRLARAHPGFRRDYISYVEAAGSQAYDLSQDPKGLVKPYSQGVRYASSNPLALSIGSASEFFRAIDLMVKDFKHFVEQNGGWRLLWNDNGKSRSEKSCQLLFKGIVSNQCRANDIDLSRESDVGVGSVDFRTSQGYRLRAHLELKLARNTRFWNGLQTQLPAYMQADRVKCGYFIAVVYTDNDVKRIKGIQEVTEQVNNATRYEIRTVVVDARYRLSASRLGARSSRRSTGWYPRSLADS